jgi:exopolysaccharide biosynthesis protein
MCLAQLGPLEYLCISSEGPEDPGSTGLTLEQFAELVASFEGVTNAYNLDGGSSSTMVFNRDKVNSPNNPKRRPLKDIIYFASAYQPD